MTTRSDGEEVWVIAPAGTLMAITERSRDKNVGTLLNMLVNEAMAARDLLKILPPREDGTIGIQPTGCAEELERYAESRKQTDAAAVACGIQTEAFQWNKTWLGEDTPAPVEFPEP